MKTCISWGCRWVQLASAFLALAWPWSAAGDWWGDLVQPTPGVWAASGMEVASSKVADPANGEYYPYVAFFGGALGQDLYFAKFDGSTWILEYVLTLPTIIINGFDTGIRIPRRVSLDIMADGKPGIAFSWSHSYGVSGQIRTFFVHRVHYVRRGVNGWEFTVGTLGNIANSGLREEGCPHNLFVGWQDDAYPDVDLAHTTTNKPCIIFTDTMEIDESPGNPPGNGGDCRAETRIWFSYNLGAPAALSNVFLYDGKGVDYFARIAINGAQSIDSLQPYVAYDALQAPDSKRVAFRQSTSTGWTTPVFFANSYCPAISVGSTGNPVLAFFSGSALKSAERIGSAWLTSDVVAETQPPPYLPNVSVSSISNAKYLALGTKVYFSASGSTSWLTASPTAYQNYSIFSLAMNPSGQPFVVTAAANNSFFVAQPKQLEVQLRNGSTGQLLNKNQVSVVYVFGVSGQGTFYPDARFYGGTQAIYRFSMIPTGTYSVIAYAPGFTLLVATGVAIPEWYGSSSSNPQVTRILDMTPL